MLVTKHSNMKAARAARREEDLRDQRSNLHYTNPVIEVGLVRARDEVCLAEKQACSVVKLSWHTTPCSK